VLATLCYNLGPLPQHTLIGSCPGDPDNWGTAVPYDRGGRDKPGHNQENAASMPAKPLPIPYNPAAAGSGMARPRRSFFSNSASRKASSIDCSAFSRGSQKVW
jgi:hypothetical protein